MTDERTPDSVEWENLPAEDGASMGAVDADSDALVESVAAEPDAYADEIDVPPIRLNDDGEIVDEDVLPSQPTWRDRIKGWLGITSDASNRLYALTHAINVAPDAAVNYVLRGELYLERKQYDLAAEDFGKAVLLAEADLRHDERSLGLLAQSIQDRALTGYEEAIRRGENGYNKRKSKVE